MELERTACLLLADLILVLHFAFICFVVLGFALIWLGYFRGWSFIRNFWFRLAHLLAMGYVAFESLTGIACPLTEWEYSLRVLGGQAGRYDGSFVSFWLHRLLFFDLSPAAFQILYAAFFLLLVLTFWKIPPRWPRSPAPHGKSPVLKANG